MVNVQVMLEMCDVVVVCDINIFQYLYGGVYYFKCGVGVEVFVYCCVVGGNGVVICFLCGFQQYIFYGVQFDCYMCKFFLNQLEMVNSFIKLYVLICVMCSVFKSVYCGIVVGQCDEEVFMVKFFFYVVEVVIFLIEYVFFVQFNVVKGDFIVVVYVQIEFFQFVDFDICFVYVYKLFGVNWFIW